MKGPALFAVAVATALPAAAAAPVFLPLRAGVTLESGDSWIDANKTYRLYGVQSCLRGTLYTDKGGHRRDCGEASLAVLAAYIADTRPVCAPVAETNAAIHVACYATVGSDRLDLANLMIMSGFAFAALGRDGLPLHPPYAVAEHRARERRAGLWQFKDVRHPAILLGQAGAGLDTAR
ncbi:Endonuclease YncB, thermonuclease family [Mesorhizobium albiziae]|uniref:Endonuclease YncB, thermonuclease family n=1 Tax=Neomesorhizobium albiziae TaxID=335020 RepID=A0A1I4E2U5_9HYPH|nr:thermonuclease family protein [Mesorhizobium albiziae]GLS32511.1 succinoglycan biosynthesis protein exoi [Mesorhizobium albiziae]SFL00124.1 Endonuclease YncB, thermonuclease family [Mesorhizobium albiziae]